MNALFRRLVFWSFVVLFLLTAPIAILYSQGYRFNHYDQIFIHSGSITVKTTPTNVDIYLDGVLQKSSSLDIINNSVTINGLRPGSYDLKVMADGYSVWEKKIEVHSGISAEYWNIFLVPENPPREEIASENAIRYFASPFGEKIAYIKKSQGQTEIWSSKINDNLPSLIYSSENFQFSENINDNIEWDSDEKNLLVPIIDKVGKNYIILDSEKKIDPILISEITEFSEIDRARWSPKSLNEIYFLGKTEKNDDANLYRLNINLKIVELIIEGTIAYDLSSSALYFLDNNQIIYKSDLDGKDKKQLSFSPLNLQEDSDVKIVSYDDDRQAISSKNGDFYVHNITESGESLKKINGSVKGFQFSNDGKKLLYWTDNDIYVLFLRKWDVQPRREENEIQQIIRFSSPLKNVFWYRDYEHIFFSTQNFVKVIELDSRDHRSIDNLFQYQSDEFLSSYDSNNGVYYYLDEVNGVKKIFFIYLPEQTGFLNG